MIKENDRLYCDMSSHVYEFVVIKAGRIWIEATYFYMEAGMLKVGSSVRIKQDSLHKEGYFEYEYGYKYYTSWQDHFGDKEIRAVRGNRYEAY